MSKSSKSKSSTKTKTSKTKSSKKTKVVEQTTPVETTVETVEVTKTEVPAQSTSAASSETPVEPTTESQPEVDQDELLRLDFDALVTSMKTQHETMRETMKTMKSLQQRMFKRVKYLVKHQKGAKKKKTGERSPGGLEIPTAISDEMAKFCEVSPGTLVARIGVLNKINEYIKEHKLQNPENKREILCDKKLAKLFGTDKTTYFQLQKCIKHHFVKAEASA